MAGFTAFLGVYNTSMQAMAFAVREAWTWWRHDILLLLIYTAVISESLSPISVRPLLQAQEHVEPSSQSVLADPMHGPWGGMLAGAAPTARKEMSDWFPPPLPCQPSFSRFHLWHVVIFVDKAMLCYQHRMMPCLAPTSSNAWFPVHMLSKAAAFAHLAYPFSLQIVHMLRGIVSSFLD